MRLEAWDTNAEGDRAVRPDQRGGEYAYTPVAWGRPAQASVARNEARINGEGRARDLAPAVLRRTSPELPAAIRRLDDNRRDTPLLPPAPLASGTTRATLTLLTGVEAGRMVVLGPEGLLIGRDAHDGLLVDEMGVSRRHARIAAGPDGSFYVEDLGSTNGTFVGERQVSWAPLASGDSIRLGQRLRVRFALADEAEELLQRKLYESSVRDSLTQVFTRRYFSERLAKEVARYQGDKTDAALLVVDLDGLKELNDRFGHLAGDRALCAVAARIAGMMRPEDALARYGGDEFVVLAPGMGLGQAGLLARRIRETIARLRFAAGGRAVSVTVSIGIAAMGELGERACAPTDLFSLADARLYSAKKAGRNCVRMSLT